MKKRVLKSMTLEEMLTKEYGQLGTKKRTLAEARIKKAGIKLNKDLDEKQAAYKKYKAAQLSLYKLVFTDIDRIYSESEVERIKKYKSIVNAYQKKYYKF